MFTTPPTETDAARHVRILYAEDVRELRDLARIVFTRDGHSAECVCDGMEAMEKLTANLDGYDLLVTDHHMPRMNGLELVAELRKLPFKGKIMVFSSEMNPAIAADYTSLGVDRILFKPVYPSFLRQAIAELFPIMAADAAEAATARLA